MKEPIDNNTIKKWVDRQPNIFVFIFTFFLFFRIMFLIGELTWMKKGYYFGNGRSRTLKNMHCVELWPAILRT